jgi:hypothetical protein
MACTRCGREALAGARLCPGCAPAVTLPPGRRPGRPHGRRLVLTTAALVMAAGTGTGLLLAQPAAGRGPAGAGRPSADAARLSVTPSGRPGGRMLRTAAGHPAAGVSVAAGAGGRAGPAAVAAFLTGYFAAINRHDYGGYLRLFGPGSRRSLSAAGFRAGYKTTRDSAETLTGVTAAGPGEVAAAVTFTSRQAPAASPLQAACVRWRITIYLARRDGRFVIENPPPGYAAADRAC